jgi:hypothetical protein
MGYSQEFIDWTKAEGLTADHTIESESTLLGPGMSNNISCEGVGYIGMTKDADGMLHMKMSSDNEQGFELVTYYTVLLKYVTGDLTPTE